MILKEAIITCHYRQVLTSVDPEGNYIVKVVSPDGRIEDVVNGGIEQYEKQRDGHKRTS